MAGSCNRALAPIDAAAQPIAAFLEKVADSDPDIVLLDYGYSVGLPLRESDDRDRPLLKRLFRDALLIAAGGNEGRRLGAQEASAPGIYPEVLAVGSVDATLPDYTPEDLRGVLHRASRPIESRAKRRPLMLTVEAAVAEARQTLIRRTLEDGPCSLQALAAITGLELRIVRDVLEQLLVGGDIRRLTRGRLERYEAIAPA